MLDQAASLRISLLGGFRAERVDVDRLVCGWQRRSAKTLTKLLATSPRHSLHREQVMDVLWPGLDLEAALNGLGKALHAARRALEPELPPRKSSQYLQLTDCMLSLHPERVVVDSDRFQRLAEDAQRSRNITAHEVALAAYGGELLPEDRYEDWCAERRRSLAEMRLRLLLGLADLLEEAGAYDAAADRLREALEADGTSEEVHRRLMRVYAEMGAQDRALRQFRLCEDALRRDLDLAPQPETVSLYHQLLEQRESITAAAVPTPAPAARPAPPAARTRLVGREQPLGSLRERLASAGDGEPGLLLVTGETGVGKSRLLSEFATLARADGAAVLSGGCGGHPPSLPFGPFAVALETYAAGCSEAERNELSRRHPGLIRWLPSLPTDGGRPGRDTDHLELSASVARLLTELGRDRPVVLVVGDLGDCDALSLDLLAYLAHLAPTRRWLLLAVLTEDQAEPRPDLRRTVDSLMRAGLCTRIELQCLSRDHCDELVSALLPGDPVEPAVLERIYAQCGGNPMFVEELIRDARGPTGLIEGAGRSQPARLASWRVPRSIRSLVARRLELEDGMLRRVLALACAAPETEIPLSWLRAGATALDATVSDGAFLEALDRAVEIGVLDEGEEGYTFRHPLVRAALFEELPLHRREQLRTALRGAPGVRSSRLRVAGTA